MSIKKITVSLSLLIIMVILTATTGCNIVTGTGETITLEMEYDNFTKIEAGYAFDIEITRADSCMVSITVDNIMEEYLNVSQQGDTVYISLKSGYIYTNTTQQATITLPDLRRLELSGAAKAAVSGFSTTESVDYELSGASRMSLSHMTAGNTGFDLSGASRVSGVIDIKDGKFNLSGASSVELEGSAEDIAIEASGASNVRLPDFPVDTADVELSGASSATIDVSNRIDIDLSGASHLNYSGEPRLGSSSVSGGSSVNKK